MHNHQSALDSQREEAEINWLFPEPDNDDILENLFQESYDELSQEYITLTEDEEIALIKLATKLAYKKFEELPEPGDYDES